MTPRWGRVHIKYAHCSYHTHNGLAKWTHHPTLPYMQLKLRMPYRERGYQIPGIAAEEAETKA